jgi:hypothetical protein
MRTTSIIGIGTALAFLLILIHGTTVRTADLPQKGLTATMSAPIDIMQMMRNAKDLPEQQHDAI